MASLKEHIRDLVIANRILAREGVVDAFGHVSIRHPEKPDRYLLSHSRSPELVTADDIIEFTLDGAADQLRGRTPYGERFIHGAIYELRPDVSSVIHNHAHELLPFGVTGTAIRPIAHVCASIGERVPIWDIRDRFGETNHLVVTMDQGRDLGRCLDGGRAVLMRGHGGTVACGGLREAVMTAIYLQLNAKLQMQAMNMGEPNFLLPGEIEKCTSMQFSALALDRAWEYWRARAGCADM